jgi:hypothetical protein
MSKYEGYTPGPWSYTVRLDGKNFSIRGQKGEIVVGGTDTFTVANSVLGNARLIADAPKLLRQRDELLEALRAIAQYDVGLMDYLEDNGNTLDSRLAYADMMVEWRKSKARAALAKLDAGKVQP